MKHLLTVATLVLAAFLVPQQARAFTELCPASMSMLKSDAGSARTFVYDLTAAAPRTLSGVTAIADTDRGWFGWRFGTVQLDAPTSGARYAISPNLFARFPVDVSIRHAWVTYAQIAGSDPNVCEVPAYRDRNLGDAPSLRRQSTQASPAPLTLTPIETLPAVAVPSANAVAVAQPWPIDCDVPFALAKVTNAVSPQYPPLARELRFVGSTAIGVLVGGDGTLLDSSVYRPSGNAQADYSALAAARVSSYLPAVSYCRRVPAYYIFKADFSPR